MLHRTDGILRDRDFSFIEQSVKPGLLQIAEAEGGLAAQADAAPTDGDHRSIMAIIRTSKDPGSGALLVSEDKKATLVVVELTTELLQHRNRSTLKKIDDLLARLRSEGQTPAGLNVALAGSAAIGRDITRAQARSARATQYWTIVFVVVLLLLLYRSPVLALVPLITIFVAVEVTLKLIALLASAGWLTVFEGMQVYLTIILYGTGVDYCLFLIARCREEHARGQELGAAVASALGKVGLALTASAAMVGCSIGMMTFARFGEFHYAGIAIAFGMLVGWCAAMTLTPAILRLVGRWVIGSHASTLARTDEEAPVHGRFSWAGLARVLQPAARGRSWPAASCQ